MSTDSPSDLRHENDCLKREVLRLQVTAQHVREREQALRFLFEAASDAIITIDQESRVVSANFAVLPIFGYPPEDLIGQSATLLMPETRREDHLAGIRRLLRTGRRRHSRGLRVNGLHRDGREIPLEISVGAIRQPDGSSRFTAILRDLTSQLAEEERERKRLGELAHLQRLHTVAEMAAGLAHELNQPLLAICLQADAAAQLLTHTTSADGLAATIQEVTSLLHQIADDAERASRIVKAVRSLARRETPDRRPVRINDLIAEVLPVCESAAVQANVRIEVLPGRGLPEVRVEPVQIEQVLLNLVQNALEAMQRTEPSRRRLEIGTHLTDDGDVRVTVRDYGEGLPAGPVEQLFDSFYTTRPGGIGLGLAICRSIIEAHGGRLQAEPAPGRGALFSLTLPVAAHATLPPDG